MQMALGAARKTPALRIFIAVLSLAATSLAVAGPAQATPPGGLASTTPETEAATETGPPGKAMLVNGRAIPPVNAPPAVKQGSAGRGRWITVYANSGHAYAVIAGLRWDTAGNTSGTGPRWHKSLSAAASGTFVTRHPAGY